MTRGLSDRDKFTIKISSSQVYHGDKQDYLPQQGMWEAIKENGCSQTSYFFTLSLLAAWESKSLASVSSYETTSVLREP